MSLRIPSVFWFLIAIGFSLPSAFAQNEIQAILNGTERPLKKELLIQLEDDTGNSAHLPIVILRGKEEGPVFTMVAGVHGFEYPPIVATQRVLKDLEIDRLRGTMIVIPVANTASFFTRTLFINPTDGKNLNRAFPGDPEGSITQKLASFITENIIPASDVFLDIHGGDACEDLIPFVCYYDNVRRPEQTQLARTLSETSGFDLVVSYPYTITDEEPAQFVFKQAVQDGKTALSIESGRMGSVEEEAVELIVKGVFNMLAKMDMYTISSGPVPAPRILTRQTYIRAQKEGIFYSPVKAGDSILEGALIGNTTDLFGNVIEEFRAPVAGVVLYMLATPPISQGDTVMCIGSGQE